MSLSRTGPRKYVFVVDAINSETRTRTFEEEQEKGLGASDYTYDYDDDDSDLYDTATSALVETDCSYGGLLRLPEKADSGTADDDEGIDDANGGFCITLASNLIWYSPAILALLVSLYFFG